MRGIIDLKFKGEDNFGKDTNQKITLCFFNNDTSTLNNQILSDPSENSPVVNYIASRHFS